MPGRWPLIQNYFFFKTALAEALFFRQYSISFLITSVLSSFLKNPDCEQYFLEESQKNVQLAINADDLLSHMFYRMS